MRERPNKKELNMTFKITLLATLAILMIVSLPLQGLSEAQGPVKAEREWSGSIEDPTIVSAAPEVIVSAKEFEALWLAWKLPGPMPEVDFSSYLVVVQATVGSRLRLAATQDDRGNLKVLGLATMDLYPGFRYVIAVLSRKDVKTVNGKELGSTPDLADFAVPAGVEVRSVKAIDPRKMNDEIGQANRKGETWPKEAVLVALRFVGAGLKGNTKSIEARTPPESQDTTTITVTESGYMDDAISGERWRLWMTKKADGTWVIERALWAQLCSRPGQRFYSSEPCP